MKEEVKFITWNRGRKLIDRWDLSQLGPEGFAYPIVPIMYRDKNGNVWSLKHDRSELVVFKKDGKTYGVL